MSRFVVFGIVLMFAAGCSQSSIQSGDISKSTTPISFNTAGASTVAFDVPDMMCPEGCGEKVKEILSKQPGVKDVIVDFPNKTATVAVDEEKFDATVAVAALKDHQFKNSALKDAGAAAAAQTNPVQ